MYWTGSQLPIHSAVKAGNEDLCRLLLEFGADYSCYLSGCPAMVLAATERQPEIIRLLHDFGILDIILINIFLQSQWKYVIWCCPFQERK